MILPHGKELIGFLPLSDLHDELSEHERLMIFHHKGTQCVACGRVGALLALGRETGQAKYTRKRKSHGRVHIDLYTDDFVLMTVDHIVPKAICKQLGWTKEQMESLDNKQPMCDPCNGSKDCKLLSLEELQERRRNTNIPKTGVEIVRRLVPNIHEMLGDAHVLA